MASNSTTLKHLSRGLLSTMTGGGMGIVSTS